MKQCLIVDDSRLVRKVARKILEDMHFTAEEAEDGASALDACRRAMPAAILLDGSMSNMASVEFLRALRREENGMVPVVVFCTTENDVAQITEAIGAGANEYIMKPFDEGSLQAKFTAIGLVA